jgi:hypothetical protein
MGLLLAGSPLPVGYGLRMKRRVFGYQIVATSHWFIFNTSWAQVEVASQPIHDGLRVYCDRDILENKINDDFNAMTRLRLNYQTLYQSMRTYPELAEVMSKGV